MFFREQLSHKQGAGEHTGHGGEVWRSAGCCVVMQEKSRGLLAQKERGHLGLRGCTLILETITKGSHWSQPVLFVLLTPVSAQSLQAGKPLCTLALFLLWEHTPGSTSC